MPAPVDDEPELGAMIAELLTSQGHEVDVVTDGRAALERLAGQTYHVILSDLRTGEFLERVGVPSLSKPFTLDEDERLANEVRQGSTVGS
jgi:DNA-binding NtrC family response regulator